MKPIHRALRLVAPRRTAPQHIASHRFVTPRSAPLRLATSRLVALRSTPLRDTSQLTALHRVANHRSQETNRMQISVAHCHLVGIAPLSQSHGHDEPKLDGESHDAYDKRTWRSKLNTLIVNGKPTVVLPAHGIHQSIAAAAKYSKRQIPSQGKATWTKKFEAGIALLEDVALNIDPETVDSIVISANADGVRGSGKRVPRRFPMIPKWECKFDVQILDPIITRDVFEEMLEIAGIFIGFGRFRPEKGGTNGRFRIEALKWTDNRRIAA